MKVTVQQQQLSHGVAIVARAVTSRSTLPVLSNILIKTDEGRLRTLRHQFGTGHQRLDRWKRC